VCLKSLRLIFGQNSPLVGTVSVALPVISAAAHCIIPSSSSMLLFTCNSPPLSHEEARKLRVTRIRSERQKIDGDTSIVSELTWETSSAVTSPSLMTASSFASTPTRLARTTTAELAKLGEKSPIESATSRAVRKYRKRSEYYTKQSLPIPPELLDTIINESAQKFNINPNLINSDTVMKRCRQTHSKNVSYFDASADDHELPPPSKERSTSIFTDSINSFVEDAKHGSILSCCNFDLLIA